MDRHRSQAQASFHLCTYAHTHSSDHKCLSLGAGMQFSGGVCLNKSPVWPITPKIKQKYLSHFLFPQQNNLSPLPFLYISSRKLSETIGVLVYWLAPHPTPCCSQSHWLYKTPFVITLTNPLCASFACVVYIQLFCRQIVIFVLFPMNIIEFWKMLLCPRLHPTSCLQMCAFITENVTECLLLRLLFIIDCMSVIFRKPNWVSALYGSASKKVRSTPPTLNYCNQ